MPQPRAAMPDTAWHLIPRGGFTAFRHRFDRHFVAAFHLVAAFRLDKQSGVQHRGRGHSRVRRRNPWRRSWLFVAPSMLNTNIIKIPFLVHRLDEKHGAEVSSDSAVACTTRVPRRGEKTAVQAQVFVLKPLMHFTRLQLHLLHAAICRRIRTGVAVHVSGIECSTSLKYD